MTAKLGLIGVAIGACVLGCVSTAPVEATDAPVKASAAKSSIVMRPAETVSVESVIVGGALLKPEQWPATLNFALDEVKVCTATLIGPRVVLTAAHCLDDGASATVVMAGQSVNIECAHHPDYDDVTLEADVALCHATERDIPFDAFERVSFDAVTKTDGRLFLLGYGCRDIQTQLGGGRLYGGYSTISGITDAHVITERGQGSVMICPGDSGGAAFKPLQPGKQDGARYVIGVNSGYSTERKDLSYMARLSTYKPFVDEWLSDNSATICTVDSTDNHCR